MLDEIRLKLRDKLAFSHKFKRCLAKVIFITLRYCPIQKWQYRAIDLYLRHSVPTRTHSLAFRKMTSIQPKMPSSRENTLSRTLILKSRSSSPEGEKGVIILKFEKNLEKLALAENISALEKDYNVLFMPSWLPFYSSAMTLYLSRTNEPLYAMPASFRDYYHCKFLNHKRLTALPFHSSSWIREDFYPVNVSQSRDIDIIMVANFGEYKRHWLLFQALRDLPKEISVAIVGMPYGTRTEEKILQEAAIFGVQDRFKLYVNSSQQKIAELLCRSKLLLGLSAHEGTYTSVAEGIMAGAAAAVYENAEVGTKDYINPRTGFLLNHRLPLSDQICTCLAECQQCNPAKWARENIASRINCDRLNQQLRSQSLSDGCPWTHDIAPFYARRLQLYYEDPTIFHRLAEEYETFQERYGISIDVTPLMQEKE